MFKFDPARLTVTYNFLKSITSALGGSMHIIDPDGVDGSQETIKVKIPFAVARKFISDTEFTKYVKPVQIAVLRYDDQVICIERDIATNIREREEKEDMAPWVSKIETFVNDYLHKAITTDDWFFDSRYIYRLSELDLNTLRTAGPGADTISLDRHFRTMDIPCVDLYESNKPVWPSVGILTEARGVIAYCNPEVGAFAVTAPIWKNVSAIGSSSAVQTDYKTEQDDLQDNTVGIMTTDDRLLQLIDQLDEHYSLNLNFTLNTAKSVSNMFGFDAVEALQLPEVMLALRTVNIPSLPKSIKSTFAIGMTPSHGLLWLMGLQSKCATMEDFITLRSAIKYLTSKGMFHKSSTRRNSIFVDQEGQVPGTNIPPVLNITEYLATRDQAE